jgi:hypothetical protein
MALTVEDGTIKEGAESYVTVADADTYHTNRLNAAWGTATTPAKEAALRKATSYIDWKYVTRWKGQRVFPAQPLMWPRNYVLQFEEEAFIGYANQPVYINSSTIPQCLKDAACEAALRALSGELAPDLDRGGKVNTVRVGNIWQVYESGANPNTVYQKIEHLLRSLLNNNNSVQLVRS